MSVMVAEDLFGDKVPMLQYYIQPNSRHTHVLFEYCSQTQQATDILFILDVTIKRDLDLYFGSDYKTNAWLCSNLSDVFMLSAEAIETYIKLRIGAILGDKREARDGDDRDLVTVVPLFH